MARENNSNKDKQNDVDEEYLMNIISGEQPPTTEPEMEKVPKTKAPKVKSEHQKSKPNYQETFLVNRFPSGRNGKVVYIRAEYHERLLRIVQLRSDDRTTLYSYIDNILQQHFIDYGEDITSYFNEHFKPIL
ncbi:DUF3408 domain-containing protein [Sphingobacterium bambusae]|uniref:DUF3408 domain-containing protein n=1 Tax=Sphingobacterium bambusae TaxID=662858 RepID=A0ABW6BBD2_9SPHI|nr:DUF3408 domain-containing protein [Sphingobacterium bambusae]WPL49168.1 DUF3408 domain-containing protein [Sphingobacterium bambusae]